MMRLCYAVRWPGLSASLEPASAAKAKGNSKKTAIINLAKLDAALATRAGTGPEGQNQPANAQQPPPAQNSPVAGAATRWLGHAGGRQSELYCPACNFERRHQARDRRWEIVGSTT
jgi:hypothetical protein